MLWVDIYQLHSEKGALHTHVEVGGFVHPLVQKEFADGVINQKFLNSPRCHSVWLAPDIVCKTAQSLNPVACQEIEHVKSTTTKAPYSFLAAPQVVISDDLKNNSENQSNNLPQNWWLFSGYYMKSTGSRGLLKKPELEVLWSWNFSKRWNWMFFDFHFLNWNWRFLKQSDSHLYTGINLLSFEWCQMEEVAREPIRRMKLAEWFTVYATPNNITVKVAESRRD